MKARQRSIFKIQMMNFKLMIILIILIGFKVKNLQEYMGCRCLSTTTVKMAGGDVYYVGLLTGKSGVVWLMMAERSCVLVKLKKNPGLYFGSDYGLSGWFNFATK